MVLSIKQKLIKFKPDLKESSIENYLSTLKLLSKYLNIKKFNLKYLKDYESIIDFLDNKSNFSIPTKRNYITPILVVIKMENFSDKIQKAYSDYHIELTNKQNETYYDNLKNEKETHNWISLDEIKSKIVLLSKTKDLWTFQHYLILNLYTLLPPIRNDYAGEMFFYKTDKNDDNCNKIILSKKQMILCNYKTTNKYGTKIIDLPEELLSILEQWYNLREKVLSFQPKYLLIKQTNPSEYMSKNLLTKTLNKIFYPKKISTTILRKVYLSEKYPVINTYREMKNDAYIMGHDINTAKLIYSKKI